MNDQGHASSPDIFGAPATPISLEQHLLHRVRLFAASVAAAVFAVFAYAWEWPGGWLIVALAAYEMGHAAYHLHRTRPLWATLLTDILAVSLAIALVRPPAMAVITPAVYLVSAPMLLTAGHTARRLAITAVAATSLATYTIFEWPAAVDWTAPRTLLMVSSFLLIFGPLILWMIQATTRQTVGQETTRLELEAARARLEDVFRRAPVGMELTGIGPTQFLAVNPAFCDFVGYTEQELLTMSVRDVVHPADLAAGFPFAVQVAAGTLDLFEEERRYIHADGGIRWANFSLSVIHDDDGVPQYAIGQVQDISRRKAAEAERDLLLELSLAIAGALTAEEAMRSVLAGLCAAGGWSIGVLWVPSGDVMKRDHTWAAHPGFDQWEETTRTLNVGDGFVWTVAEARKPIEVASIAEDRHFIGKADAAAIGIDVALGIPVLAGDEVVGVLLLLGSPSVNPDGDRTTVSAVVTHLGQAIAVRLAEEERDRLAAILEHSTDFAGLTDPQGRVRYINPAGRAMLGIDPDEDVATLRVRDFHPPEDAQRLIDEVTPEVLRKGAWRGEATLLTREGRTIPISQVILAHRTTDGKVSYLSTVARDISMQKALEEQQAEAIRSKDEFIASVSHELRTPLTAVRGFAEILHQSGEDLTVDEREEMLAAIASESADVSDIVEDLLVAARSDIDQLTINPKLIDIAPLIRETAARVRWGNKVIEVDVPELVALVDPLRLRQILRNLMVNAVRYGGDTIRITAGQVGPHVLVEVADDGEGITHEFREDIFAPYRRAHDRAGLPGSVGLGLAVSRRLARLMDGDLTYSSIDTWTTFALRLPRF
ncbi:MAG: PAS domain S-box protein [Acidimicrobiia bacterium]